MKRLRFLVALAATLLWAGLAVGNANAQAVVQAYQTDNTLQVGMIIQLADGSKTKVQAASQQKADKMRGVVVAANDAPISISGENDNRQAYVATSGNYKVLVSDQNGSIGKNPLFKTEASNVPDFLQKLTDSVANKPVSAVRIYVGLGILLATVIIVFSLLYSGVRTSMVSLGRNPLAKKSILRNLFEVVLIGLIVLISGLFGVYLLLKL